MSIRNRNMLFVALAAVVSTSIATAQPSIAADPVAPIRQSTISREPVVSFAEPQPMEYRKPTAMEMRQARAWDQQQQRLARIEANNWAGYDPSRPTLPANPFTQLHAPIYRPYHIWSVFDYAIIRY